VINNPLDQVPTMTRAQGRLCLFIEIVDQELKHILPVFNPVCLADTDKNLLEFLEFRMIDVDLVADSYSNNSIS
jgi:hypothetical protein